MQRIKLTFTIDFFATPSWYEKGTSVEEMLKIELESAKDSPIEYLSNFATEDVDITGEIIS